MYKLNPEWPSDNVKINDVSVNRDTVLTKPIYEKYTKPMFKGKPPLLVKIPKESESTVDEPEPFRDETFSQPNDPNTEPSVAEDSDVTNKPKEEFDNLRLLDGVGPVIAKKLYKVGYTSYASVAEVTPVKLATDIGRSEELSEKIIESAKTMLQG